MMQNVTFAGWPLAEKLRNNAKQEPGNEVHCHFLQL
jgi:hypothetical protein